MDGESYILGYEDARERLLIWAYKQHYNQLKESELVELIDSLQNMLITKRAEKENPLYKRDEDNLIRVGQAQFRGDVFIKHANVNDEGNGIGTVNELELRNIRFDTPTRAIYIHKPLNFDMVLQREGSPMSTTSFNYLTLKYDTTVKWSIDGFGGEEKSILLKVKK